MPGSRPSVVACSTASPPGPEPESKKGEPVMTYDHDDPRLTAYALGELDASQFADVQQILDASEEARKYVAEIRLTADWLARELQKEAEAPPILSLANHRAIDQTLQQKTSEPRKRRWWKNPRALSVVASILVLCWASAVTFTAA